MADKNTFMLACKAYAGLQDMALIFQNIGITIDEPNRNTPDPHIGNTFDDTSTCIDKIITASLGVNEVDDRLSDLIASLDSDICSEVSETIWEYCHGN